LIIPGTPAADAALVEMTSLVRLLGEWTRSFPYDFRDDRMMALIRSIYFFYIDTTTGFMRMLRIFRCAADLFKSEALDVVPLKDEMSLLLQKLLDRLTALEQYEATLTDIPFATSTDKLDVVRL
jgi:hypothetical protein